MISTDYNRRLDVAAPYQLVYGDAKLGPLAVAEPANTRRQSLKMNPLFRQLHPARQNRVFRKECECQSVGALDVRGIPTQSNPAEWTFPLAKKRSDILRNEPGNIVGIPDTGFFGLGADVIAIIEGDSTALLQFQHRADVLSHRLHRTLHVFIWIFCAQRDGLS